MGGSQRKRGMKERNGSAMTERRGFRSQREEQIGDRRGGREEEIWQCDGIPGINSLIRI